MNKTAKIIIISFSIFLFWGLCQTSVRAADDYLFYGDWNLGAPGYDYLTGVNGYTDKNGLIEGRPGAEYIFFAGSFASYQGPHTAYVYRVETNGDPEIHPNNSDHQKRGPVGDRKFTLVSTHFMGNYASGHDNGFYVDDTGIYYGASDNGMYRSCSGAGELIYNYGMPGWGGVFRWDHKWNPLGWVVNKPAPYAAQTFSRNSKTGDWWVTDACRGVYKWDGSSWAFQFRHPNLLGDHSDGMEVINGSLFISDMTSDAIIQYRLNCQGNIIDPPNNPYNTFYYLTPEYRNVEEMGYGPNNHIWVTSWNSFSVYELGGGRIQSFFEGIPDQKIHSGESFKEFNLNNFVKNKPIISWKYSGNNDLKINIDNAGKVAITYPLGWVGSEAITFQVTDKDGSCLEDEAIFTVLPFLGASLKADPPEGTAPLMDVDLVATISSESTAKGSINYTFWCNCSDAGTNINEVSTACGVPNHKKDNLEVESYRAVDVCDYQNAGKYFPKVIVERGLADPVQAHATTYSETDNNGNNENDGLIVKPNNSPNSKDLYMNPSECGNNCNDCKYPLTPVLYWTFDDDSGDYQTAFEIHVADNKNFNNYTNITGSKKTDSSKIGGKKSYTVPSSILSFGKKEYYWRVMVWDNKDVPSNWVAYSRAYITPANPYPQINFSWFPENIYSGKKIQFTDETKCFDVLGKVIPCKAWQWAFQDASPADSIEENPSITFLAKAGKKFIIVKVTDSSDLFCEDKKEIKTSFLPKWREIFSW